MIFNDYRFVGLTFSQLFCFMNYCFAAKTKKTNNLQENNLAKNKTSICPRQTVLVKISSIIRFATESIA